MLAQLVAVAGIFQPGADVLYEGAGDWRIISRGHRSRSVWPHMLRDSCGNYLADQGTDLRTMQDYLGHRDPKHTAHYTRVAGHRFEGLWR